MLYCIRVRRMAHRHFFSRALHKRNGFGQRFDIAHINLDGSTIAANGAPRKVECHRRPLNRFSCGGRSYGKTLDSPIHFVRHPEGGSLHIATEQSVGRICCLCEHNMGIRFSKEGTIWRFGFLGGGMKLHSSSIHTSGSPKGLISTRKRRSYHKH